MVSSATPTAQSKPMNTQPPTARAASSPAVTEPPDSASAPNVSPRIDRSWSREHEQQREPDPDGRDHLRRDPGLHRLAQHADAERAGQRADHDQHHAGDHDRVGSGLDVEQGQRPRRAEVGDRRVRGCVRADRDPAREPAVGASDQPAAPLVRAAGDRELRSELGVDGQQQALAGQRHRQHPHPRRAPRPASRPAPPRTARRPARSPRSRGPRCRRSAGAGRAPACSRARPDGRRRRQPPCSRCSRSTRRATSTRDETPSFMNVLRMCDSTVFWLRNSFARDLGIREAVGDQLGDLALARRQRPDARDPRTRPSRAPPRGRRACAARAAPRRACAPSRTRRATRSASRSASIASVRSPAAASARPGAIANTPPAGDAPIVSSPSADVAAASRGRRRRRRAPSRTAARVRAASDGRQLQVEARGQLLRLPGARPRHPRAGPS